MVRSKRRWIVAVVTVTLLFGSRAATAAQTDDVQQLVNTARASASLPVLQRSGVLDALAQNQAQRMRAEGRIFHNVELPDQALAAGIHWSAMGENVGVGASPEAVEQAFMESEHHKANILDGRFEWIGVGVAWDDIGTVYVTQVFARIDHVDPPPASPTPTPTPAPMHVRSEAPKPRLEVPAATAAPPPAPSVVPASPARTAAPRSVRAEDGSLVVTSFYDVAPVCTHQGWVGSASPWASAITDSSDPPPDC